MTNQSVKTHRTPPGPNALTRMVDTLKRATDPLGLLTEYARRYGDVVRLTDDSYLINHPDLVDPVLAQTNRRFVLDNYKDFGEALKFWGRGLPISQGAEWQRQRRLIQPVFQHSALPAHAEAIVAVASQRVKAWGEGQTLELLAEIKRLTLEIGVRTMLGLEQLAELDAVEEALEATMRVLDAPTQLKYNVSTPDKERFRAGLAQLDEVVYRVIRERRASDVRGSDLLSQLLTTPEGGQPLTDEEIRDLLVVMLRADHKNTSTVLVWAWYLLAQHPAVVTRLEAELDEVLGNRLPTFEDFSRLSYTEALFKETMRLYPLYALMGRETRETCEIGGYAIPAGKLLLISPWLLQRDPRHFDAPNAFQPERWARGLEARLPKYAYFPFGGGPRLCLVTHYSMLEGVLLITTLAQQVRFSLLESTVRPQLSFNGLRPREGLRVRVQRR